MAETRRPTYILPSEKCRDGAAADVPGPRRDYSVLAARLGGASVLYAEPTRWLAPVERRIRFSVTQAVRTRRAHPPGVVSLSERAGMPFSLLGGRARHVMVGHLLTSPEKRRAQRLTRFLERVDVTLVFSRPQERYLREEVGLAPARARFVHDKVDHRFFVPGPERASGTYVLAVGRERRDYETLIRALTQIRVPGVIVAGSSWSHRRLQALRPPSNVRVVQGLSYAQLRGLYQQATLAVVPIEPDTDYAAGVNGVLEAMACGLPTIVSATPGLADYVQDGTDGHLVPPGDQPQLANLIERLWNDSDERERVGQAARATVENGRTLEQFADHVLAALGS